MVINFYRRGDLNEHFYHHNWRSDTAYHFRERTQDYRCYLQRLVENEGAHVQQAASQPPPESLSTPPEVISGGIFFFVIFTSVQAYI